METRRQDARLTINKEFDSFDQFVREYVTNISRTGVFIKTATPLPVGHYSQRLVERLLTQNAGDAA